MLRVPSPDLRMHILALRELNSRGQASPAEVKEAIKRISAMNPTESDVSDLSMANIFSVRLAAGHLQWTNSLGDFAITDRKEYEEAFRSRISILDFTREEVRTCESFFVALGLQRKFLSQLVTEETCATGGYADNELTQKLKKKAFAIYLYSLSDFVFMT
jgi:hypothetical protein